MRFLLAIAAVVFTVTPGAPAQVPKPAPSAHLLTMRQVQKIVRRVARHDRIDLTDTHVEVNSLDLMSPFIPGYASFILIREATSPGPDQTLHRYAVNRRTGDVWEMTQCTRYNFPALTRLQRAFTGRVATPAGIAAERQQLGCSEPKKGANPL